MQEGNLVTRTEKRWVVWFALIVIALTCLPYWEGFASQGNDWRFTGLLLGAEDGNSYLAKMLLGASGDWLFRTPYTPFHQNGFMAFLPYYLVGKLSSPPGQHAQLVALFHLFRCIGGFLSILATYDFLAIFLSEPHYRRLGTALTALGGGLALLSVFGLGGLWAGRMPLEYYSPETFGFLQIFALPHLAVGRALLLWGLRSYLVGSQQGEWRARVKGGLMWMGLGWMQPLTVVVGWAVLGGHLVADAVWGWVSGRKEWTDWWVFFWRAFWMGVISSPLVLYTFVSFQIDPFLRGWQGQNIILSPPPGDYLLAFGVALPLAVTGMVRMIKSINHQNILLVGWAAAFPFLAYAPTLLQRRLPEGIWVVWAALAMIGLRSLSGKLHKAGEAWLFLAFTPALMLLLGAGMAARQPNLALFRPVDETAAFAYLAEHADKGKIVLAAYDTSNVLPTYAPLRVLIGHGPESLKLKEIQPRVEAFFAAETDNLQRKELLNEFNASYVVWGPQEKKLGGWTPTDSPYLDRVYQNNTFQVFHYRKSSP